MIYLWPVVIFVTFPVLFWLFCRITRDPDQARAAAKARRTHPSYSLTRLADPEPLPGELEYERPFPPAPALLMSEAMAAVEAHEREIKAMLRRAEKLGMLP